MKVQVTKEHNAVYEGSVIYVDRLTKKNYFGIWSSAMGSYPVKVKKKYCNIIEQNNNVLTIIRKNYPINVLKIKISNLDTHKCSTKFLANDLDLAEYVYVKCDIDGKFEYRGKKKQYRIYDITTPLIK